MSQKTKREFMRPTFLAAIILCVFSMIIPSQSFAACELESAEDAEQSIRSLKCRASDVRARRDALRKQIKEILLKRIEEYRGSPEFVSTLRSMDASRTRLSAQERFAVPLADTKRNYLAALEQYASTVSQFVSDSSLGVDTSSLTSLRVSQAKVRTLVENRHIQFTRARFDIRNASIAAEEVCRHFARDGGFRCRFPEPDYSNLERHLVNLNTWRDVIEKALEGALESNIEARKSAIRKETMAFEASAAFFGFASSAMRAYMEGPERVAGAEVYVTFISRVDALLAIPCETPASYQASGCKSIASQVASARDFRAVLPRYIREDLPTDIYEKVKRLPLEEQVAQHEAYFRGIR